MWKILGLPEKHWPQAPPRATGNLFGALHGPLLSASIIGRLRIRQPEKVNQVCHRIGINFLEMAIEELPITWKFAIEWPEIGKLSWHETKKDIIELGKLQKKRLSGKQPDPTRPKLRPNSVLDNVEIKAIATNRKTAGSGLSHQSIRDRIEWTQAEKKELVELRKTRDETQTRNEEKRLLHNRKAKEKGMHPLGSFTYKAREITAVCKLCGAKQQVHHIAKTPKGLKAFLNVARMIKK